MAVFEKSGAGILITHSAGGGPGWLTAIHSDKVKGIIALEPGTFPFPKEELPEVEETTSPFPAVGQEVSLEDFMRLTKIPIVVYFGDNIPSGQEPVSNWGFDNWRTRLNLAHKWAAVMKKYGGDVEIVSLPDVGVHGSTHFMMADLNNVKVADVIPNKTVEVVNYLKAQADAGNKIFYDIYNDEEKISDPRKKDTGIFFFRGKPNEKFALCSAGGGFYYVGAMHDSFPHALELSKQGYNAFALIYRPNAQLACEDLARAIAFVHEHADELQIDTKNYSLWGGSAGARMSAWLGSFGTEYFGEKKYPRPAAVIMQYTGLSEVYGNEPPTYNCVGTHDGIASWQTMKRRVEKIRSKGTAAEIEIFEGLGHGFGLGEGTVAEGWIDNAIKFWNRNSEG